jgi:hypothetical protein
MRPGKVRAREKITYDQRMGGVSHSQHTKDIVKIFLPLR